MYTVNGKSVSQLYSERTLSEGDVIEWFYTDDYTKEDLKPAYDAREVMAMIQALPETDSLTLSDAADVQQAKSAYDALSAEEKAKVTDEARKKLEAAFLRSQNSRVGGGRHTGYLQIYRGLYRRHVKR